jgi:hypothetical protein
MGVFINCQICLIYTGIELGKRPMMMKQGDRQATVILLIVVEQKWTRIDWAEEKKDRL